MKRTFLFFAIQSALTVAFAAPIVGAAACGGTTESPVDNAADASSGDAAIYDNPLCRADTTHHLVGDPAACERSGGELTKRQCGALCNGGLGCSLTPQDAGPDFVQCLFGGGRRPEAFAPPETGGANLVGEYFAQLAALEGASVDAFEILADELAAHDAPARLIGAARRAARDEVRHARAMGAIARRYGADVIKAQIPRSNVRSLERIALENAVEGCIRETLAAAVAAYQAETASDPRVRSAMKRIAADELRHAELSLEVAAWCELLLDDGARQRLAVAREEAIREVEAEATRAVPDVIERVAGHPSPARLTALVGSLRRSIWDGPVKLAA